MIRVLFVDDDASVLSGLRRMLHGQRGDWEMRFVTSGALALQELESWPAEVVVSDMRMPEMDGAALLARLRDEHPDIARIILSGHTELAAALRSVPVAQQFLSKPCEPQRLVETVHRAGDLQKRLNDARLRAAIGRVDALPSAPHTILALNEALVRPEVSLDEVVEVVSGDIGMSAKILQIVNSAFFGLAQHVTDIRQAVAYLGVNMLRNVAATVEAFRIFTPSATLSTKHIEQLQAHSAAVAELAHSLIPDRALRGDVYIAALLHDVGLLAIASELPEALDAIQSRLAAGEGPREEIERAVLGATHADVGAYLLSLWGLPYGIIETVARHEDAPTMAHRDLDGPHATYVAEAIICSRPAAVHHAWGCSPRVLDPDYVEALGLTAEVVQLTGGATTEACAT